jgi:hypothetical protein
MQKTTDIDRLNCRPYPGSHILTSKLWIKNRTVKSQSTAKTYAAIAISSLASILVGQSASVSQPQRPKPSAEMRRLLDAFSGTWSTTIEFNTSDNHSPARKAHGTEVWRPGPGGLSIIEDYQSTGANGEVFGLAVAWWEAAEKRYQFLRCESTGADGCIVLKREPNWENGRLALMEERQENGQKLAIKEIFFDITPTTFKQTIYQGKSARELMTIATIFATKVSAATGRTPDLPAQHPGLRIPGPAVQNNMLGTFSIKETDAGGAKVPESREVWRPGPGGYSVIEESYRADGSNDGGAFAPAWWDAQAGGQRFVFCSDKLASGCVLSKSVAKWEGEHNVYTEERVEGGKKVVSREIFQDISASSFLQLIQKGDVGGRLATTKTMRATKISAEFPIHSW